MAPKRKPAENVVAEAQQPTANAAPTKAAAAAPPQPNLFMAALEAGGVQAFMTFTSQALAQVLGAGMAGSPHGNDWLGLIRLVFVVAMFSTVYGSRFRPAAENGDAAYSTGKALLKSMVPRVDATLLLIMFFHIAQVAFMTSSWMLPGGAPTASEATACMSSVPLVWGVWYEELVYRGIVFYIVLQRSGGRVQFATLVTALIFGGVHIGSIAKRGADGSLVILQSVCAMLFGVTYSLLFAATGSLGSTALAHTANNAVALVWLAVDPSSQGSAPCTPRFSTALAGSVAAQAVVYLVAAGLAYRGMAVKLATPVDGGASNAFRSAHPVVYGEAPGANAEDKGKKD